MIFSSVTRYSNANFIYWLGNGELVWILNTNGFTLAKSVIPSHVPPFKLIFPSAILVNILVGSSSGPVANGVRLVKQKNFKYCLVQRSFTIARKTKQIIFHTDSSFYVFRIRKSAPC